MLPYRAEQRDGGRVSQRPAEFLIIHGIHADAFLLAGNEDAGSVLSNGDEGAGLDVVVHMVFNEGLDSLASQGLELYFVEDDKGLALHEPDAVD